MSEPYLDQKILTRILTYNPDTGLWVWNWREDVPSGWNTRYSGKIAGYEWSPKLGLTYRCIRIFDWPFLAHRLAFLYMIGRWPEPRADHADMDGLNNRWANLREATASQNAANTRLLPQNKTGFKGVCQRPNGIFRATITRDGKQRYLGHFKTAEEAHAAYCAAAANRHGEFERMS